MIVMSVTLTRGQDGDENHVADLNPDQDDVLLLSESQKGQILRLHFTSHFISCELCDSERLVIWMPLHACFHHLKARTASDDAGSSTSSG